MDLKPMFETNTINFVSTATKTSLEKEVISDPDGIIPNGIYRVIDWQIKKQIFGIALSSIVLAISSLLIILYSTVLSVAWVGYSIPLAGVTFSSYYLINLLIEKNYTKKSVISYKENLKVGINSTPPFISKMYMNLHKKQVSHNWLTFTILFYGGITTLLLYWLKDFSWWIFDFKSLINWFFDNPTLMTWLFTIMLIVTVLTHLVFAIHRKKRVLEIDAYFGEQMATQSEIETVKAIKNKMFRRLFILSVMVLLMIPIIVRIFMKGIAKRTA